MAKRGTKPPYTAAADVEAFFDRIETIAAPKKKFDKAWVESFLPTIKQPEGIPALVKWLGIVGDDGTADPTIWNKVSIPQTRAEGLSPLVREAYSDVFEGVNVEEANRGVLNGTFKTTYDEVGNPQRYVGCFLALCKLAGIATTASTRESKATSNGSGSPAAAKKTIAGQPNRETKPKIPTSENEPPPAFASSRVTIVLNVEIPADWTEAEIRERIAVVTRAVRETGVAQA